MQPIFHSEQKSKQPVQDLPAAEQQSQQHGDQINIQLFKNHAFTEENPHGHAQHGEHETAQGQTAQQSAAAQQMQILSVAQRGEAVLQLKAAPVSAAEFNSPWLQQFSLAMYATMTARNGVGIAAPQVFLSKRIIIVGSRPNARYPDAPEMDAVLMINPEIIEQSSELCLGEEGCLSVPNARGQVSRAEWVKLRYYTMLGEYVEAEYHGFPARIVQHEIDHLDGVLFVDRI